VVTHLDEPVKTAVLENLKLDNLFTFSWYPLAMVISILSAQSLRRLMRSDHSPSNDSGQSARVILIFLITAQVIAFILDRIENVHIMQWINKKEVHTNLVMFKTMVWAKFLLTLPAAITAVIIWIISCKQWKRLKRSDIYM
jgi:hypothetical protein